MSDENAAATPPNHRTRGLLPPWQKGQSGNPAGRPVGARNKLTEHFLEKLQEDFERDGESAIVEMRVTDPTNYIKVIASLLPRDVNITARPFTEFTDDDLLAALRRLEAHYSGAAGAGQTIEGEATRIVQALPEAAGVPRSG